MIFVDKRKTEHTAIWLLQAISQWGVLSDIYSKQAQFNTVFIRLIKMDRVGFEPTTSGGTSYSHAVLLFFHMPFYDVI
jgi:hypothetical protein